MISWFSKSALSRPARQPGRAAFKLLDEQPQRHSPPVEIDGDTTTSVESAALGRLAQLPPFSPVALLVLRSFDREEIDIPQLARSIGFDPALSAEILAHANSPLYALQSPVADLQHAITVMGLDQTKRLTTTLTMRALLKGAPRPGVVRRLWKHSIATAAIASELAPAFGVNAELADTAGILHDLGRIGLLAGFRDSYPAVILKMYDNAADVLRAEFEGCGSDHCAAGLFLSEAWGFPTVFQNVIGRHHEPQVQPGLLGLMQIACTLADDLDFTAVAHTNRMPALERIETMVPAELREAAKSRQPFLQKSALNRVETLDS
jgi:putative nucleotidyltransferase with HDIG domain